MRGHARPRRGAGLRSSFHLCSPRAGMPRHSRGVLRSSKAQLWKKNWVSFVRLHLGYTSRFGELEAFGFSVFSADWCVALGFSMWFIHCRQFSRKNCFWIILPLVAFFWVSCFYSGFAFSRVFSCCQRAAFFGFFTQTQFFQPCFVSVGRE